LFDWDETVPAFPKWGSVAWACRAAMGTPTTRKSIATIHAALGAGITMLDTGDSELIHGEPECGLLLVNLQALLSRLSRICRSRMGSTVVG